MSKETRRRRLEEANRKAQEERNMPRSISLPFAAEFNEQDTFDEYRNIEADNYPVGASNIYCRDVSSLLSFVVGKVSFFPEKIKVIDFGGGAGCHYVPLKKILGEKIEKYYIVELQSVIDYALTGLTDCPELQFCTSLDDIKEKKVDLIYCNSALQYTKNVKKEYKRFFSFSPEYVLLERMPVTTTGMRLTAQIYDFKKLSYWFTSVQMLKKVAIEYGYELVEENFYCDLSIDNSADQKAYNYLFKRIQNA
jgi:putative methyltransferase (TIGR04325 family)